MVSDIGKPFQGIAYYAVEDSYGSGLNGEPTPLAISNYIQNVRVGTGDKHAPIRGFDSAAIKALMKQTTEPEFHLEYNPQCDDTLLLNMNRDECCKLKSLVFVVGLSTCTDGDNASYFVVSGCKPSTIRISSTHNAPYTVTVDYLAKGVEVKKGSDASSLKESAPAELSGSKLQFNVAGEIVKSDGDYQVDKSGKKRLALITNSIDVTIDNQLTGYTDHDALVKDFLVEGTLNVSGSVDITMDGGGALHLSEVLNQTPFSIMVYLGGVGCPVVKLVNCQWDTGDITGDTGGEAIMSSCPFTAVPSSCSEIFDTAEAP